MEIDIKKVMPSDSQNHFETISKLIKAQQDILTALHIMQSALDFPEFRDENKIRMEKYLKRFCK